jgi:SAM-dependent methyltransferase
VNLRKILNKIISAEELYNKRVQEYGYSAEAVGWRSFNQQKLRFEKLVDSLELKECSILDVGCGFGDLAKYLIDIKVPFSEFLGIDVSEKMIEMARLNCVGRNIFFRKANFFEDSFETCDWIFMSGVLNLFTHQDQYELYSNFAAKALSVAKKGISLNLLGDKVDFKTDVNFYYNLEKVQAISCKYFRNVRTIQDYGLYEFTIQLYN